MDDEPTSEDCLQELHREHEVAMRLIERLEGLAGDLDAGRPASAAEIREAAGLLDAYLHRLHADRLDAGLVPDAKKVAMPECFEHLDDIAANHERMRREEATLEEAIAAYAAGAPGAASTLSVVLLSVTGRDREEIHYEEDYPLSCLPSALTKTLKAQIDARFAGSEAELRALEARIQRCLAAAPRPGVLVDA